MSNMFSYCLKNPSDASKWVAVAEFPSLVKVGTATHLLKIYVEKPSTSVTSVDLSIVQYYANIYPTISNDNKWDNKIKVNLVKEASGNIIVYVECPAKNRVYTQLELTNNPSFINPVIGEVPNKDVTFFEGKTLLEIGKQYKEVLNPGIIRLPAFSSISAGKNAYKFCSMEFYQSDKNYGGSFTFKVQEVNANYSDNVSCELLAKIWYYGGVMRGTLEMINCTNKAKEYLSPKLVLHQDTKTAEIYLEVSKTWTSINVTPIIWDYSNYTIKNIKYYDNPSTYDVIPDEGEKITHVACIKPYQDRIGEVTSINEKLVLSTTRYSKLNARAGMDIVNISLECTTSDYTWAAGAVPCKVTGLNVVDKPFQIMAMVTKADDSVISVPMMVTKENSTTSKLSFIKGCSENCKAININYSFSI